MAKSIRNKKKINGTIPPYDYNFTVCCNVRSGYDRI